MKNILIIGGAGFIGSHLAMALKKLKYNVTVLDNLSEQVHGNNPMETSYLYKSIINEVDLIAGSVTNKKDIISSINGMDAIIHLAAETGTGQSMYQIDKYSEVNIGGTALLLDILANRKHSIQKLIVASSRAIYGEGKYQCSEHGEVFPNAREINDMLMGEFECKCPVCKKEILPLPTTEDSKFNPLSIYGITKLTQEQMVLTVGKSLGLPTLALRYQNVYGPGQALNNPYTGILSIFSNLILNNRELNIFEDGKESRDFVYINDVIDATIMGLMNNTCYYGAYNVGSGVSISVTKVAELLFEFYDVPKKMRVSGDFRLGDIRHNIADLSLSRRIFSYQPKYEFAEGIKKYCEWVISNKININNNNYENSLRELRVRKMMSTVDVS